MTRSKEEKEAKAKAKAEKKAAKKAAKEAKAKAEAMEAKSKPIADTAPKGKKPVKFRYLGKGSGRYVGKEFFPHPEFGTVMVPAAEGEQRIQVAKGGIVKITDPDTIKRLEANPKWERVK